MQERRRFLALTGALLQGLALPRWLAPRAAAAMPADPAVLPPLPAATMASAAVIGRRYIALAPEEADRDRLAALLAGTLARPGAPFRGRRRSRQRISDAIRRDFAAEEVVMIDGWMLSRTEARLCALTALARQG